MMKTDLLPPRGTIKKSWNVSNSDLAAPDIIDRLIALSRDELAQIIVDLSRTQPAKAAAAISKALQAADLKKSAIPSLGPKPFRVD